MPKIPAYLKYIPILLIIVFSFVIYSNTLFNDYALDDSIVITDNAFTKKGLGGIKEIFTYDSFTGFFGKQKKLVAGGRYRPLSIASFATEYSLFKGFNPFFSHFMNIFFYALTGILIFLIFLKLLKPDKSKHWYLGIPFLAAILFIAHPVHTEVVANIKGRDEIFALLFSLTALWLTLSFLKTNKYIFLILGSISFFLGLLSKENAILFVVIVPLTIFFFTSYPLRRNIFSALPLLLVSILFIVIRYLVLGYFSSSELPKELLNNPFLSATEGQKAGTILYTLGLYIKLLFVPHPLTHDYYPYHIPLVDITDLRAIIPLLVYIGLLVIIIINFRKKGIVTYGILFYLLTLFIVSNIVFPVGTFMNERFIYMPSLGFVLILAWFFSSKLKNLLKKETYYLSSVIPVLIVILSLFSIITFSRNSAWKDDFTLFTTDVKVSENSTKCNTSAGGKYLEIAQKEKDTLVQQREFELSLQYLNKALSIYPMNTNSLLLLGNLKAVYKKDLKGAIDEYMKILSVEAFDDNAYDNTLRVLMNMDDALETDYKIGIAQTLYRINPDRGELNYMLGKLYGQFKGNLDTAEFFFSRTILLSPDNTAAYKDLGVIYGMKRNYLKALEILQKAAALDPKDEQVKQNILLTMKLLGRTQ